MAGTGETWGLADVVYCQGRSLVPMCLVGVVHYLGDTHVIELLMERALLLLIPHTLCPVGLQH